jgi:phosphotransferase system enzyme I (PtsP)
MEPDRARALGRDAPRQVKVGAMLEVPSLLWQLDALLRNVDFLSLGTNDLLQYFYAADRNNPRIADRYDVLSPGFLTALLGLFDRAKAARVTVCVCGEMASKPLDAMALVALGARTLSVAPQAVGSIKAVVRSLDAGRLAAFMAPLVRSQDQSLRDKLSDYARDHDTVIDEVAVGM